MGENLLIQSTSSSSVPTMARFWPLTRTVAASQVQTLPSQGFWSRSGNHHLHNFTGNYVIMVVLGATRKSTRYFGNIKPHYFSSFFLA